MVARAVMPGKDSLGIILTTGLGIAGAFVGQIIGQNMHWAQPGEPASFFASVMGALLILFVLSFVRSKSVA